MPKSPTVGQLHKKLQPIFNHYIRLRDTGPSDVEPEQRVGKCISCSRIKYYAELQAGHFLPDTHYITRYDERNVNAQCGQCNGFRKSNWPGYTNGLAERYGEDVVWSLLSTWGTTRKYTVEQLQGMIADYLNRVKELEHGAYITA